MAIKTTGDLRTFLTNMMIGVRDGDIKTDKASVIIKAAAQVNESFYSEVKVANTIKAAGGVASSMGNLPIAGGNVAVGSTTERTK